MAKSKIKGYVQVWIPDQVWALEGKAFFDSLKDEGSALDYVGILYLHKIIHSMNIRPDNTVWDMVTPPQKALYDDWVENQTAMVVKEEVQDPNEVDRVALLKLMSRAMGKVYLQTLNEEGMARTVNYKRGKRT